MRVVVQAYGRQDIVDQAVFSVLSYLRWKTDDEIMIYTDQVERLTSFFEGFKNVRLVSLPPEQVRKWRGEIDFVHRVKLEVLKDASRDLKQPLLYLDGDTVLIKDPSFLASRIGSDRHLMHVCENRMDQAKDPLTKKIAKFCKRETLPLKSGALRVPASTEMWNAGVIGIDPSQVGLLEKMIEFTDVAYALYQKHVIEQLAVSYFLQTNGLVQASDDVVLHYWRTKDVWQKKVDAFLAANKTAQEALGALSEFDWSDPAPPPKKNFWQKLFS